MFLNEYLNDTYLSMLYNNYKENYINSLDEKRFVEIYNLFKEYNFYFIEDIILYYLEVFQYNVDDVRNNILLLKERHGDNFIFEIGNDLSYLEELL